MIRAVDIILSGVGLFITAPILFLLFLIILGEGGAPLFCQRRVGKYKKEFVLIKFRTMSQNTPSVASHLIEPASITRLGTHLRKSKIDELPQLWNVLKGDMSLVGPRPNLPNQLELITERDALGLYNVRPGITGLAQLKSIDMSSPKLLAKTDFEMMNGLTLRRYFIYIFMTVIGRGTGDGVKS